MYRKEDAYRAIAICTFVCPAPNTGQLTIGNEIVYKKMEDLSRITVPGRLYSQNRSTCYIYKEKI